MKKGKTKVTNFLFKKNVIKNLHKLNIPIEKIAQAVELKEEEVKAILNEKKQKPFAIAKGIHN